MTAFSRGCTRILPRPLQTTNQFLTSSAKTASSLRNFTTNPLLNASNKASKTHLKPKRPNIHITESKPAKKVSRANPTPKTKTAITNSTSLTTNTTTHKPSTLQALISDLSTRTTPTLLYTSPSQKIYHLTSYLGGISCLAYTAYTYESVILHGPPDLSTWVMYGFGGVCFFTGCVGAYLIFGPTKLVNKIFAIPASKNRAGNVIGGRLGERRTGDPEELKIQIQMKCLTPKFLQKRGIFPPKIINTTPSGLTLSEPITPPPLNAAEKAYLKELEAKRQERWKNNIISRPFQKLAYGAQEFFEIVRRVVTREGFVKMEVRANGWVKLDKGGWIFFDGNKAALEKLCKTKQKP